MLLVRPRTTWWFGGVAALYAAVLVYYAETAAFTVDEGYHMLAAQLITKGKIPYLDFCFPQTPLNAYWNALWLRLLGQTWRVPHLMAALTTSLAVWLTGDFVLRRFPDPAWRLRGAVTALLLTGLSSSVFAFGSLQPYGLVFFALVATFRLAVRSVEHQRTRDVAAAGFFAGVAAASSLLSVAAVPVFLIWTVYYQNAERRIKAFSVFLLGIAVPFLPVLYLFVRGPQQTWFNLYRYHAVYRPLYWPDSGPHDLEVITGWIHDGPAMLLGLLAAGGMYYVLRRSAWPAAVRREFGLGALVFAALGLELSSAHPTFPRYFLLLAPFLAIPAAAGLYALAGALGWAQSAVGRADSPVGGRPVRARFFDASVRLFSDPVAVLCVLAILGWGRTVYQRNRDLFRWSGYERIAAKINEITPPGAALLADDPVYFATRRTPPSGFELSYSHLIKLPPKEAALFHILHNDDIKRLVQMGSFPTVYSCYEEEEIAAWDVRAHYRKSLELEDCTLFWDWKAK